MTRPKKIGVLTSGGDCPGLNAALRAVVVRSAELGIEVLGIRGGYRGFYSDETQPLTLENTEGIASKCGTILTNSRLNPFQQPEGARVVWEQKEKWGLDAVIAVGGEGTLSVARLLHEEGFPIVGVPKTIDNDVDGTDYTFGFDTAVSIATEAIDRLRTTAEAHERVMVVEVMGRRSGWIAAHAGLAGDADVILVPERPCLADGLIQKVQNEKKKGNNSLIVVVAEGALFRDGSDAAPRLILNNNEPDVFGRPRLGGVGAYVADLLEANVGLESRVTVLGHVQRGGSPTPRDRVLAMRLGNHAVELVWQEAFGNMSALKGASIGSVSLQKATQDRKALSPEWLEMVERFTID